MKRALVTGAGGFVGRWTLQALIERGYEVHAWDLREAPPGQERITWHRGDLLAPGEIGRVLRSVRPTHLLHMAWYAAHGKFWHAEQNVPFLQASLELLLTFQEIAGQRMVGVGTCAEYDWAHGYCAEGVTPLRPATLYGVAKDALRRVLESFAPGRGISWAWARLFLLYGPNEDRRRLVASAITSLLQGQEAPFSHGQQVRDFMHVRDVAGALVALLDSAVEGAVNVASGTPTRIRDLVEEIAGILQTPQLVRFGALPAPPDDPPLLLASTRRLVEEVRFVPRFDLHAGLKDTIEWWRGSPGLSVRADERPSDR